MPGHLIREVAQSGSAPRSGRGGRWFESSLPDYISLEPKIAKTGPALLCIPLF